MGWVCDWLCVCAGGAGRADVRRWCRCRAWAGQGGVILSQVTDASRLDPAAPPEDDDRTLRRPCRAADMMSYAPLAVADAEVSPARRGQASGGQCKLSNLPTLDFLEKPNI